MRLHALLLDTLQERGRDKNTRMFLLADREGSRLELLDTGERLSVKGMMLENMRYLHSEMRVAARSGVSSSVIAGLGIRRNEERERERKSEEAQELLKPRVFAFSRI